MNHTFATAFALLITLLCCTSAIANDPSTDDLEKATRSVWELGLQSLIQTEQSSRNLSAQLDLFLAEPTATGLTQLRQEWRNCHQQWQHHAPWMALARSQPRHFATLNRHYFSIDASDLQPGYLDAVQGYPFTGIVNDISIVLTADNLRQQHGLTDHREVSLGFHALEFLLWGEQGERPFNDFTAITDISAEQNAAGLTTSDLPNNRRRTLLRLTTQLLADDLQRLRQDWQNPLSATSRSYLQLPPPRRLEILRHTLRELLALELPDQLLQFAGSDQSTHHNQFAGDTQQHYLAVLTGVETLLTQGESPLLNQLLTAETAPDWQRQLQNLIAGLNEAMQEKEEGGTSKLASLREQLPLLAVALAGEPADTTAERP